MCLNSLLLYVLAKFFAHLCCFLFASLCILAIGAFCRLVDVTFRDEMLVVWKTMLEGAFLVCRVDLVAASKPKGSDTAHYAGSYPKTARKGPKIERKSVSDVGLKSIVCASMSVNLPSSL